MWWFISFFVFLGSFSLQICRDIGMEDGNPLNLKHVCVKTTIKRILRVIVWKTKSDYEFTDKDPNITALYVNRKCGMIGPERYDTCKYMLNLNRDLSCYSCDSDLCNRSAPVSMSVYILILILIVRVFLNKIV